MTEAVVTEAIVTLTVVTEDVATEGINSGKKKRITIYHTLPS